MSATSPVLAAYDGHALGPLRTGELLARLLDLPLVLVTAYAYEPASLSARALPPDINVRREERAEEIARGAARLLDPAVRADVRIVPAAGVAGALVDLATETDATVVVVGADLRGDTAGGVVRHAPCPVVVSPADALLVAPQPSLVGVAYDGSPASRFALTAAAHLAELAGAPLRILTVGDDFHDPAGAPPLPEGLTVERRVLHGDAGVELRRACEDLDLIACGSHARGRIATTLLGSVSSRLVDDAICPVLVVAPTIRRRADEPLRLSTGAAAR
ncbi:MAG TPA: universal stress protein [Baekduia sp.]|nr:universal stress protein [Baekduia sp.]